MGNSKKLPSISLLPVFDDKTLCDEAVHGKLVVNDITKSQLPDISGIQNLLRVSEKRTKPKREKRKHNRKLKSRHGRESMDSSLEDLSFNTLMDSSDKDSSEEDDTECNRKKQKKGKNPKSGYYERAENACLVMSEWYAHTTLDDEIGGDKELASLSFNLRVAEELEIIMSPTIGKKEKFTRLEVLKKLAYKHEHLNKDEIVRQYTNFIRKIEKGKFKWGSLRDIQVFEQQLIYAKASQIVKKPSKWNPEQSGRTGRNTV